jgi:hypothetical protein
MTKIAVIYHTTYGHTKAQAEAVHRGAQSVSSATLYTVEEGPPGSTNSMPLMPSSSAARRIWAACPPG